VCDCGLYGGLFFSQLSFEKHDSRPLKTEGERKGYGELEIGVERNRQRFKKAQ